MRHSLSHIMAQAVLKFYPNALLTIGPDIDKGFYYDIDLGEQTLSPGDLKKLEQEMRSIINADQKFEKFVLPVADAKEKMKSNPYKSEMIVDLEKEGETEISFYNNVDKNGTVVFTDMCRGPHLESTKQSGAFKLTKLAGAYWRGSEKNKMLQRIYGLAFETKEELENYLKLLEEAEKRDHRIIGKDLFILDPVVGLGLPLWKPKGARLWRIIEDFWYSEHLKNGYELVRSPHIGNRVLWETSGHWNFYNESMYPVLEVSKSLKEHQTGVMAEEKQKEEYLLKPMNCPFHVEIYNAEKRSYRDLPVRWAECGTVYRYEKSGELSGLTRVRGFTQDDAHIICTKEQVEEELKRVANFVKNYFNAFGFKNYKIYLSLRDPNNKTKYAGNDAGWEFTEAVLEKVAKELGIEYQKEEGEAAFYGPKLDYKIKDALGREWQCATLQFDFNLPERFNMTFVNAEGKEEQTYMLHRALMGSFERFIGLLIEHYAAAFPVWLSPEQVRVLPISEKFNEYAETVFNELKKNNLRVVLDDSSESLNKRIRNAEKAKVPYILVIGEKEMTDNSVAVRRHGKGDLGAMPVADFVDQIVREDQERVNE